MSMTELNREQFQNALHDLGYGDFRSAKIWFLGIDDGNGIWEPEEILDIDPYATLSTSENAEDKQAASVISKIITGLINPRNPQKWEEYLKKRLFTEGSEAFLTYMFPIGRGTQDDWFSEYEKICGVSSNDYYHYVLKERPGRLGYLQDHMQAGSCRLLVLDLLQKSE